MGSTVNTLNNTEALQYLAQYGYVGDEQKGSFINADGGYIKKALMDFQSFVGIEKTGVLDKKTAAMMKKPRCGMKDKTRNGKQKNMSNRFLLSLFYFCFNSFRYGLSDQHLGMGGA